MSSIDRKLVEHLTGALTGQDRGPVKRLFSRQKTEPPVIIWEPDLVDLRSRELSFLHTYWSGLHRGSCIPLAGSIDPIDMRPALGHIVIVEPVDGGADFRYRLFGTEVARRYGEDMTGRLTSEIEDGSYIAAYFLALYRAVSERRVPLFSRHFPSLLSSTTVWERLMLPLADGVGSVGKILVGQVPGPIRTRRAGR